VKVDPNYFRPTEVELLIGNAAKAEEHLNWKAQTSVEELCKKMVFADLKLEGVSYEGLCVAERAYQHMDAHLSAQLRNYLNSGSCS